MKRLFKALWMAAPSAVLLSAGFVIAGFAPETAQQGAEGAQAVVEWVMSFIPTDGAE